MKKMIKSALALVAAVVVSSGLFAAMPETMVENIPMSVGGATNVLTVANHDGWAIRSADESIATVAWEETKLVITGVDNGSTTVYARNADASKVYTFNISIATMTIEKTIKQPENDLSNATIRVVSHAECGTLNKTPNILFIGSWCGKHELSTDTIQGVMEKLVDNGNVDWYFFANGKSDYNKIDPCENGSGTFSKGASASAIRTAVRDIRPTMDTSNTRHCNLKAYMTLITNKLNIASADYKYYDYIVLEFDSDRLFEYYDHDATLEASTALCLWEYYDKERILWVVDNKPSDNPWGSEDGFWYTPTSWTKRVNEEGGKPLDVNAEWNAVVALLDPELYLKKDNGQRYAGTRESGGTTYYTLRQYECQATYNNPDGVNDAIDRYMKLPSYEAQIADNVATVESKLKIPANSSVTLYTWTSGTAPDPESKTPMADQGGWSLASGDKLDIDLANNSVKATNLAATAWTKIEIKILADDDFLVSAVKDPDVCTYNAETQTYEVNPNKGEAKMTLYKNLNGETTFYAAGAQAAMNAWNFEKRESTGDVVSVTRVYDGTPTNIVAVGITPDCGLIEYSKDGGISWLETNPTFTNAGTYPVWYRVTYENAEAKKSTDGLLALPFTNDTGYVCITQRVVTVTAKSAESCSGERDAKIGYDAVGLIGSDKILSGAFGREDKSSTPGEYAIVAKTPFSAGPNYTVTAVVPEGVKYVVNECGCEQLFCAYAYRVKLAGKTVTGKELTKGKAGTCDYESDCWAKPASFRVAGYIYNASLTEPAECEECECNAFADVQSHFWTADRKQAFAGEPLTFDVFDILRNGGLKNKAQLCIKIGENIKLAGFGAFNPESRKLKSANGFFAGTLAAPTCGKLGEDCEWGTTPAKVFAPCALEEPIEDGATAAIVYGRWTMTYKADKVRQIEEDDNFDCLYPTGFTYSAVP